MTRIVRALALVALLLPPLAVRAEGADALALEYVSPRPGSSRILPETNVILRPGPILSPPAGVSAGLLVTGSLSGTHSGRLRLSDDRRTITFRPDAPFLPGEIVTCRIQPGLTTDTGEPIAEGEFSFTIAGPERDLLRDFAIPSDADETPAPAPAPEAPLPRNQASAAPAESLPFDFPAVHATTYGPTAPGRLFVGDIFFNIRGPRIPSYLMILENDGTSYHWFRTQGVGLDFKVRPNGLLTWFDSGPDAFYAMNARYAVVDSFRCGNGYSTDNHDLLLLPNGHAVLMSYDPEPMDLSALGGLQNAIVIGLILQELDTEKNVVFQWRSWDHFQVTDMVHHRIDDPVVDYVHGNSIDVDAEGNFILSSRHMNEVTKISRATGEILWRLGGKNNQFTFVNEPVAFSHQHDARLSPGGRLTMFDNGNFRVPAYSRAVEYELDEVNRTATRVWEYRLSPDVFGVAFGSVQRLSNGNTLIGWGATTPTLTEVTPEGSIVERLSFDPGVASYRAFRFEWPPVRPADVHFDPARISLDPPTAPERDRGAIRATIAPIDSDFALEDVLLSSVRLDGLPADTTDARIDKDGLSVDFGREALEPLLQAGTNRLEVSGALVSGEMFRGTAELEAVGAGARSDPNAPPKLVSAPGRVPVEIDDTAGVAPRPVAVYDVRGRLVKRWVTPAGARVRWDGHRSDGRPASSGIYWIRVESGAPGRALKVAMIR